MSDRATRRTFLRAAAAMGATFAWGDAFAAPSRKRWLERRDLFAEGVASGDPAPDSVAAGRTMDPALVAERRGHLPPSNF